MSSLKPRLLTAAVGISLLVVIILIGEAFSPVVSVLIGIASAFMTGEYLNARGLLGVLPLSLVCMAFSVALPILITTSNIYILLVVYLITLFAVMIAEHKKLSYHNVAFSAFGTLLISFGMSAIPLLCNSRISFAFYFCTIFALPWMADAGGFFIGAAFGKKKLCPSISPKKTVEGALGGILFCVISALLLGLIFQFLITPGYKVNFIALVLLGLITAPVSILGDLSFSLIKRSLKIKDYGSIFPGHGGMLDRFDSIIFTAPVVFVINSLIPLISMV